MLEILKLQATIPPKALMIAHFAFLKDFNGNLFEATPHGFACLIITVVGSLLFENNMFSAEKMSL